MHSRPPLSLLEQPFAQRPSGKTKPFFQTSSIFVIDSIKHEAILRNFLQKREVECRVDGLVARRFAMFPSHVSEVPHLPRKSDPRSYEVLHLSRRTIIATLMLLCLKISPVSGNQRPDLLTVLTDMSLVLHLPRKMHLSTSSSHSPRCHRFWNCYKTLRFC